MSHDPLAHGPEPEPPDDPVSRLLSRAQFVVTAVLIGVVATLTYTAGFHSSRGGGGGAGGAPATAPAAAAVDVQTLLTETPELVAKGKQLYAVNCASCHGTDGKGDGPAAAALNPKPRDYTSGYWRYGGGVARIVQTITDGSPGTAMAAFPSIPVEDRFALAHYVRTFHSPADTDKPADTAWLQQKFGGGAAGATGGGAAGAPGAPAGAAVESGPTIPIERALAALAQAPPPPGQPITDPEVQAGEGAALYAARCASCHGATGEGGVRTRMLGSAPYVYLTTKSLGDAPVSDWPTNEARFDDIVLRGLSGYVMPANGDLSTDQLRALYVHTQMLRARQEAAAHTRS